MVHRFGTICVNNRLIVPTVRRFHHFLSKNRCGSSCFVSREIVDVNLHPCLRLSSSTRSNEPDDDFFGIKYFTANDIKGIDGMDEKNKQKLDETIKEVRQLEGLKASSEGFQRETSFGKVRYDRENKVDYTGQFEHNSQHVLIEKRRRYMLGLSLAKDECPSQEQRNDNKLDQQKDGLNLIEQQYFKELTDPDDTEADIKSSSSEDDLNYIDYQYFKEVYSPQIGTDGLPVGPIKFQFTSKWDEYNESLSSFDKKGISDYRRSPEHLIKDLDKLTFSGDTPLRSVEEVVHELMILKENQPEEKNDSDEEFELPGDESKETINEDAKKCVDIPKTALDYVTKIRQGQLQPEDKAYLAHLEEKYKKLGSEFKMRSPDSKEESFDSTGKRNFLEQTPRLYQLRRDELVDHLANRVIFNERDLIAIDKPNGLIVEGGSSNSKYPSLEAILPDLSKTLFPKEDGKLYIVHRLDRDATGVLLLARSLSMVSTLKNLFAERKISKYYWAIIRGVPHPPTGIIDIPIEAEKVNGIERMCLRPECDVDFHRTMGSTRGAFPATTHYRLLRKYGNACLIELKPEQGIKHQIRVHLGFCLRTPILGDHKYSNLDKLVPQKLPDDMLTRLNIRQTKVRNIPLHLHAKLYIIPGIGINGGNISIPAHLPGFFRKNLSSLGLYKQESLIKNPIAF